MLYNPSAGSRTFDKINGFGGFDGNDRVLENNGVTDYNLVVGCFLEDTTDGVTVDESYGDGVTDERCY